MRLSFGPTLFGDFGLAGVHNDARMHAQSAQKRIEDGTEDSSKLCFSLVLLSKAGDDVMREESVEALKVSLESGRGVNVIDLHGWISL